jgi:hypothetical protein
MTKSKQCFQSFGKKLKVYAVNLDSVGQINPVFQLARTEKISVRTAEAMIGQAPSKLSPLVAYQSEPRRIVPLDLSQIQLTPELCSETDIHQVFGVVPLVGEDGFKLIAQNGVACVKIPVSLVLKEGLKEMSLIEVKYEHQSDIKEKPSVCLFDNRLGRCTGQRFPDNFFELEKDLDNYQLQFALDAINSQEEKFLLYKNIKLAIYEPMDEVAPVNLIQEAGFFDITALNRQPRSCGGPEALQLERKIIEENGERYIEYASKKGSNCDSFIFNQLPHNQSYALIIESRNIEGLPLRLCLTNQATRRCDLYTEIPRSESFKKEVFLIPPMGETSLGYDVNINNHSIGKIRSVNHLKSIQIFPIKYDWLQFKDPQTNNFIVLDESYEKSWLALEYESPRAWRFLKSHQLVNNWANGWVLEEDNSNKIIFIFLPQLLEYFGFLLLLIFSCSVAVFLLK